MLWDQVPRRVQEAVESFAGGPVVEAVSQSGGFSPGVAARLQLEGGERAFVKAMRVRRHPPSARLYRLEADAMRRLPAGLPVPKLLGVYDRLGWIALVYEDVDGRHPVIPWGARDLELVGSGLSQLAEALRPSPWPDAPTFADLNAGILDAPEALLGSPPPDLDPRLRRHLERYSAAGIDVAEVVRGDALIHTDLFWHNVLLTPDHGVVFVDWSWACNAAPWLDVACFAMALPRCDGHPR